MSPRPGPPGPPRGEYVTHAELNRLLSNIDGQIMAIEETVTKIGERQVSTQADVDALTAALAQEDSDLNTAVAGIQAEIAALQSANPALDLSALSAQVDATRAAVAAASALVPPATA